MQDYSDRLANAGCNDMPQEVFTKIEPQRMDMLMADFTEWDKQANSEDWEPRARIHIPDFLWVAFLLSRLAMIDAE